MDIMDTTVSDHIIIRAKSASTTVDLLFEYLPNELVVHIARVANIQWHHYNVDSEMYARVLLGSACTRFRALLLTGAIAATYWHRICVARWNWISKPCDFVDYSWHMLALRMSMRLCVVDGAKKSCHYYFADVPIYICVPCQTFNPRFQLLNRATATRQYLLRGHDFANLVFISRANVTRRGYTTWYRRREIERVAWRKYGDEKGLARAHLRAIQRRQKRKHREIQKLQLTIQQAHYATTIATLACDGCVDMDYVDSAEWEASLHNLISSLIQQPVSVYLDKEDLSEHADVQTWMCDWHLKSQERCNVAKARVQHRREILEYLALKIREHGYDWRLFDTKEPVTRLLDTCAPVGIQSEIPDTSNVHDPAFIVKMDRIIAMVINMHTIELLFASNGEYETQARRARIESAVQFCERTCALTRVWNRNQLYLHECKPLDVVTLELYNAYLDCRLEDWLHECPWRSTVYRIVYMPYGLKPFE